MTSPSFRARVWVAFAVAACAAIIALAKVRQNGLLYDFAYFWVAGKALLSGTDPYAAVRPGVLHFDNWFMYPLPAAMVAAAFAWLPMHAASIAFVAVAFGLLAFALTADGWRRWPILMSSPALWCVTTGQWAPLVVAAALSPAFAWAATAKPTLGLVAFVYRPSRRFALVAAGALVLSLAVRPDWPIRWWEVTQRTADINYAVPLLQPFGWLLGLAAVRWRLPEGRLLLGMACVPQSMLMYDQFPLLLISRTRLEAIAFSLWTYLAPFAMAFVTTTPTEDTKAATLPYMGRILVWTLYLPALAVVLLRRNDVTHLQSSPHRATDSSLT